MLSTDNIADKVLTGVEAVRTPEEETLMMRLGLFNNMRWLVIIGVIAVTLIARYIFDIYFPTIPVYSICAFMALYNLALVWWVNNLRKLQPNTIVSRLPRYVYTHIFLDMFTAVVLLHFTGGIENPFIFIFVIHVVVASVGFHYWMVYLFSSTAIALVTALVILEYTGGIPHVNLEGFASPTRYEDGSLIVAVLGALAILLYSTSYISTAIVGELRKRQREVRELRESLLHEKTRELERASDEIGELKEERDKFLRFIGIAAHDLKAPLTAIQGFLWVMLGGFAGKISEKQKNMLERSTLRITELLNLISDLLDIPRIETGQIVQEMNEISLTQIIKDSLENQQGLASEKGLQVNVEVPEDLPKIVGSASRLQQVLTNLVHNAIKYTTEGAISVSVQEREKDLLVEVQDTGIGIPPEDKPRIFEDFFRASNVETKGTGLGLSISKRIVEAHGGEIWFESPCSQTNTGSKFSFTLPKPGETKRR